MKRSVLIVILMLTLILSGCSKNVPDPETYSAKEPLYLEALEDLKDGSYAKAFAVFTTLGDYKDCKDYVSKFAFMPIEITAEDDGFGENIVLYQTNYTYNEFGKLVTGVGKYTENEGPGYSEKHSYDADGRLISSETESEAGFSKVSYEYNEKDQLIKTIGATEGANVGSITTHKYDENGNRTETVCESYHGTDTQKYQNDKPYHTDKTVYTYNGQNKAVKAISSYGDSQMTYTAEYNENGMPTIIKSDDGQGFVSETVFEYDENGNCTKIRTPYDETVFTYDNSALPKTAIRTRGGGKPCNITYKYELCYMPDGVPEFPFFMDEHLSVFGI